MSVRAARICGAIGATAISIALLVTMLAATASAGGGPRGRAVGHGGTPPGLAVGHNGTPPGLAIGRNGGTPPGLIDCPQDVVTSRPIAHLSPPSPASPPRAIPCWTGVSPAHR